MTPEERYQIALRSRDPGSALRSLALALSREGYQKEEIYAQFEKFLALLRVREDHCPSDEDVVLDVMDAIVGWCHAGAQLFSDTKAN